MPTINLNKQRVLKLANLKLTDKELREKIPYLGTDLEEINEKEIVVEIFPNRPDLLSEEGFARALSAFLKKNKGLKEYEALKSEYLVKIEKDVEKIRPFTACAVIKNLALDEDKINDIIAIQEKMHITYGRNRKKCAIGVYPLESIKFPITYTALSPEKIVFRPLGSENAMNGNQILKNNQKGKEYAALLQGKDKFPVFIDSNKEIMSMPPIINSEKTGKVTTNTKDFFVECSGNSFETVCKALNMLVAAFSDMGGKIYSVKLDYWNKKVTTPLLESETIVLETNYVEKYLGFKIAKKEIVESLEKLGYGAKTNKENVIVSVPAYRTDIIHKIDLVEDVAIGYGYDKIPEVVERPYTTGKEIYGEKIKRKIRILLASVGLVENNSFSLISSEEQKKMTKDGVEIKNSVSSEYNSLRTNLVHVLLKNMRENKRHEYPQTIFEIGRIFLDSKDKKEETGVEEKDAMAVLVCSENSDFTQAKQILDYLFQNLGLQYVSKRGNHNLFQEGRTGEIYLNNKLIGVLGEIKPEIISFFDIELPVSGFEIELKPVVEELKKINNILD